MAGSQKEVWEFAEYQGYDKHTLGAKNHFVQYEIPEGELMDWARSECVPETRCEADCGDAVFFHRNLVHKSNENQGDDYAFALVSRIWCPIQDLTLAGGMAVTPYGGDKSGRPGLVRGMGDRCD